MRAHRSYVQDRVYRPRKVVGCALLARSRYAAFPSWVCREVGGRALIARPKFIASLRLS